ncbi:MAG: PhoX family phosphatase [Kofleriaceae bacterium]
MSRDADDEIITNVSSNPHFQDVLAQRRDPSRRGVLAGGLGMGALGLFGNGLSALLGGCGDNIENQPDLDAAPNPDAMPDSMVDPAPTRPSALGFTAVPKSLADTVTVPAGYTAVVLYALGDPINNTLAAYKNDGTDAAASFAMRAGDHHDGMHYFGLGANGAHEPGNSTRALLVMNHEAITPLFLHPNGPTTVAGIRTVAAEVDREFFLHGVSVIEIEKTGNVWTIELASPRNRRIHTLTEMELSGPLRGAASMVTKFSTDGTKTRGTVNNCANGYTPWGTYLTCEENWAGYFRRITTTDNPNRTAKELAAFARYGIAGEGRELWATVTPDTADNKYGRWNTMVLGATAADDYRNAANTYGFVVEIDPFSATSVPRKRTALGRFAHEGAWPAKPIAGKPIVYYSGDDSRGEYIYKFVSATNWDPADATSSDPLATGSKYLDNGKLYAAKFEADGTGRWLELTFGMNNITAANAAYAFADQNDVLLHSRLAADAAGATKMDRPEWGAVDSLTNAVYVTLTNNSASVRTLAATDAANPRHYNDPKNGAPQYGNPNGHIIRFVEPSPEATTFTWDIFLFGANADADADNVNVSKLTADSDFSSPDGLWFSHASHICWIQTDDGAYTDVTNCMMLAALPGTVGDGGPKTITNVDQAAATKQVTTKVGAELGSKLKRFLVGPKDCEITGIAESPDGKTLFVNIQHPGETTSTANINTPLSSWPSTVPNTRPRSATIIITKNDGGVIGL